MDCLVIIALVCIMSAWLIKIIRIEREDVEEDRREFRK